MHNFEPCVDGGRRIIRILFYVEPLTELGRPLFHEAWLGFSAKLCEAICGGGFTAQAGSLQILTNVTLAQEAEKYGIAEEFLSVLQEKDLLDIYQSDYLSAMIRGYRGELADAELDSAAALVKETLGTFTPDIVITYTTAPHLSRAFPDALVLHMEYGMYSRAPFPESFYLDPFGKFANSALGKFSAEISAYTATRSDVKLVEKVRHVFLDEILLPRSPFHALTDDLRRKYRKLVLLPLQFSGHYGFDATCSFDSQAALLQAFVESVTKDVGIIVLPHSTAVYIGDIPEKDWLDAFFARHPNVLMHPMLSSILYPSQFMLGHVDGVASVSSSVALQGLLWGTSICALGESHINSIADQEGLDALENANFDVDRTRSSHMLSWLLSHYYIPGTYFFNPDWILNHLQNSLQKWRSGIRDLSYFSGIDDGDTLAKAICNAASYDVPTQAVKAD